MADLGWDIEGIRQKIMEKEITSDERRLTQKRLYLEIARMAQRIVDHETQIKTINTQLQQDQIDMESLKIRLTEEEKPNG